jgi:hypothetical protein
LIEADAKKFLMKFDNEIKKTFNVSEVKVETHFVVVYSLGVVPKETTRTLKKMFKINGRTESQMINSLTKRMALAALK